MRALLPLLLVATALGGCITTSQPLAPSAVPDLVLPHSLTFEGCSEQAAVVPVPADEMQGFLPDGFSLVTLDPAGRLALIFVLSFTCGTLSGAAAGEDAREMTGLLVVVPPEDLRVGDDTTTYGLPLGTFTNNEAQAAVLRGWGYASVEVADIGIGLTELGDSVRLGRTSGSSPNGTLLLDTAVQGEPQQIGAGLARIFTVQDGAVTGALDVHWTEHLGIEDGQALLRFEGGSTPLPPTPGLAMHFWAEDYTYHVVHKPLAELRAEGGSSAAPGLPHGLTVALLRSLLP